MVTDYDAADCLSRSQQQVEAVAGQDLSRRAAWSPESLRRA
jgi:hypothetical protein